MNTTKQLNDKNFGSEAPLIDKLDDNLTRIGNKLIEELYRVANNDRNFGFKRLLTDEQLEAINK